MVVAVMGSAAEGHAGRAYGDRTAAGIGEPETDATVGELEFLVPAAGALRLDPVDDFVELLAGDIGIGDDEAGPAAAGMVGHEQVDSDDDAEKGADHGDHVGAGKLVAGEETSAGQGSTGALKVET